jgi:hypothetical protein
MITGTIIIMISDDDHQQSDSGTTCWPLQMLLWFLEQGVLQFLNTFGTCVSSLCVDILKKLVLLDLKFCDDGILVQILRFWILSNVLIYLKHRLVHISKKQNFVDWICLQLGPVDRTSDSVLKRNRTTQNVQKHNICSWLYISKFC